MLRRYTDLRLMAGVIAGVFGTSATAIPVSAQQSAAVSVSSAAAEARAAALLARPVTVRLERTTLKRAVQLLSDRSGVEIYYRDDLVNAVTVPVTLRAVNMPLGVALEQILAGTNLRAVPSAQGAIALRSIAGETPANQGVLVGKVVHAQTNAPIANATVTVGSGASVTTGADGTFRISVAPGEHQVAVRAVGMTRQSRRVTVTDEQTASIDFRLESSASVLDEVIVTGTVVATERKAIPNPITVITAEEIERRGITRIEEFFRGEVPGVVAIERGTQTYLGGNPGGTDSLGMMTRSDVYARGASNVSGVGAPNPLKTYVDGVEILNPSYLGTIDPQSIERIEIITGPQAATIYGSGAMGGVMQIFTKKGTGRSTPDLNLTLRYGVLENNFSTGKTPTHNHVFSASGGNGPSFSYSGTLSYNYTGQWQPDLFNRMMGASVGVTHARGPITVGGSVSVTAGRNGTATENGSLLQRLLRGNGEWAGGAYSYFFSKRENTSNSQTVAFNVDYRPFSFWTHQMSVGRSQTDYALIPVSPKHTYVYDTLYAAASSNGQRTSVSYSTTLLPKRFGPLSSTVSLGVNGSDGQQTQIRGCMVNETATSYITCVEGWSGGMTVARPLDSRSWGGFGTTRLALFDQLHFTLGVRIERNPAYGREHKIDWTPANGLTYTFEIGDLSIKTLGSYGRATRAPTPDMRLETYSFTQWYTPAQFVEQFEAPELRPEYSRGPQGGIEVYYGNLGSFTINRYRQTVTDLIQRIVVDSFQHLNNSDGSFAFWTKQYQNMNVAEVRQDGWESTMSLNVKMFSLRGTYSWMDSRVLQVNRTALLASRYYPGMSFLRTPSHAGSFTVGYAYGGTNVTLVTNFIGKSLQDAGDLFFNNYESRLRLTMYKGHAQFYQNFQWAKEGYAKSNLSASHRLNTWATARVNVVNLENNYGTDVSPMDPALGRQTTIGVSLRFPPR